MSSGGRLSRLRVVDQQWEAAENKSLDFHDIFRMNPDLLSTGGNRIFGVYIYRWFEGFGCHSFLIRQTGLSWRGHSDGGRLQDGLPLSGETNTKRTD